MKGASLLGMAIILFFGKVIAEPAFKNTPLTMNQTENIRQQMEKCWAAPVRPKNIQPTTIILHMELGKDGSIISIKPINLSWRYATDVYFHDLTDSAIKAAKQCSPIKNLPIEKYESWRVIEMMFDPGEYENSKKPQ